VLFNADAVEEIRHISRLPEAELVILIGAFEVIGQHFRQVILATPTASNWVPTTYQAMIDASGLRTMLNGISTAC
jgi:hypothetical protein